MGGAQPLAITMAEGVCLAAEVESWRAAKRVETRYLDKVYENLDEGIDAALEACRLGEALSIGVIATAVDMLERLRERGIVPDVLTDQTSAHDPMVGYLPQGMGSDEAAELRQSDPQQYLKRAYDAMRRHVELMVDFQRQGSITFDYGNNLRGRALEAGFKEAFDFPGFVPAYIRPLFARAKDRFVGWRFRGIPRILK